MTTNRCNVTVIIPVFNGELTIGRAINSVLNQTCLPAKLIIIDDASEDGTLTIIKSYFRQIESIDCEVIEQARNMGPGISRNIGWEKSNTEWIAFLDADDAWHPKKLEIQLSALGIHPEVALIATNTVYKPHEIQTPDNFDDKFKLKKIGFTQLLFRNSIPTRSVLIRNELPFRFRSGLSEDFDLWLRLLYANYEVIKVLLPLTYSFKPDFSKEGLSGDLTRHEIFELKSLFGFFQFNPFLVTLAVIFSIFKYLRRSILAKYRQLLKREY